MCDSAAALLNHVACGRDEEPAADTDLADEVLAHPVVLVRVDRGWLIAERDGLEQVAGEQCRRPRLHPILVIVWSVLARSHVSMLQPGGVEPYGAIPTLSVDRAHPCHGNDVVVFA